MTKAKPYWVSVKGKGDHGREARVLTQCMRKRPVPGQKIGVSVKLSHKSESFRITPGGALITWLPRKEARKIRDALSRALRVK